MQNTDQDGEKQSKEDRQKPRHQLHGNSELDVLVLHDAPKWDLYYEQGGGTRNDTGPGGLDCGKAVMQGGTYSSAVRQGERKGRVRGGMDVSGVDRGAVSDFFVSS